MAPQPWKTLESRLIYANNWMRLREDVAELPPDKTEFFELRAFPFAEVLAMVVDSEIRDSMTVIAVLHAARLRGSMG